MTIDLHYKVGSVILFNNGKEQSIIKNANVEIHMEGMIHSYKLVRLSGQKDELFGEFTERQLQELIEANNGILIEN
jgi:hypothetical protein